MSDELRDSLGRPESEVMGEVSRVLGREVEADTAKIDLEELELIRGESLITPVGVVSNQETAAAIERAGQSIGDFAGRFCSGDWGEAGEGLQKLNRDALKLGQWSEGQCAVPMAGVYRTLCGDVVAVVARAGVLCVALGEPAELAKLEAFGGKWAAMSTGFSDDDMRRLLAEATASRDREGGSDV